MSTIDWLNPLKITALKNFLLYPALLVITVLFGGCSKNDTCTPNPPSSESLDILAYASANGMNVTAHSSGLYYQIIDQGSGGNAMASSKIKITYVGKLLNGAEFDRKDSPNNPAWSLNSLIEGWQIGIPLIQKGGHIKLLVPSALAYGCKPYGPLPGNSILFFDITLVDIQ